MGIEKIYEKDRQQDYAERGNGQVVSRSLYAVVERGDMPLDGGFGEAAIVEVSAESEEAEPTRVRIDTVPQDTIAASPDSAAAAAMVMQGLSDEANGQLGFRVDYQV